jgi:hypothetical protein
MPRKVLRAVCRKNRYMMSASERRLYDLVVHASLSIILLKTMGDKCKSGWMS